MYITACHPAIQKIAREVDLYTQRVTYKLAINQKVSKSVLLSILYLFIIILISEFLNNEPRTIRLYPLSD